jgi:hypothetical protein
MLKLLRGAFTAVALATGLSAMFRRLNRVIRRAE